MISATYAIDAKKASFQIIFIMLNYAFINLNRMKFSNMRSAIAWGIILLIVDIVIIVLAK
jgi:hypothetical protein